VLLDPAFPHPLLGSVHMTSSILVPDPGRLCAARGAGQVRAEWSPADCESHQRGTVSSVALTLYEEELTGGDRAGGGRDNAVPLWRGVSRILFFHRGGRKTPSTTHQLQSPSPPTAEPTLPLVTSLALTQNLTRHWSALSGDINPIHVHPMGARLLGFRGPAGNGQVVAHGMALLHAAMPALLERAAAAAGPLLGLLPAPSADPSQRMRALRLADCRIDVAFVRPVFLPGTVFVHARPTAAAAAAAVAAGAVTEAPHASAQAVAAVECPFQLAAVVDRKGLIKVCIEGKVALLASPAAADTAL